MIGKYYTQVNKRKWNYKYTSVNNTYYVYIASYWCVEPECYEVTVLGLKQGSNTKHQPNRKSRYTIKMLYPLLLSIKCGFFCVFCSVSISKRSFLEEFHELVKATPTDMLPISLEGISLMENTYNSMKRINKQYETAKAKFLGIFPSWYTNDSIYEQFKLP